MEFLIILIIIIALGIYIPKQPQSDANKEHSNTVSPGIFSNISEGNDEDKNQEPPKFQIDKNFFTIDGLDKFFDNVIEFVKSGDAGKLVKHWLVKHGLQQSDFDLYIIYAVVGTILLIFSELILILGIIVAITYFAVKQIKRYRDKNPSFVSSPSSGYIPEYSTYGANDLLGIPGDTSEIGLNIWLTDRNHISGIIGLFFLIILNNRQFDSDGGASILDLILVYGTYALFLYWGIKMIIIPVWNVLKVRKIGTDTLFFKNLGKFLWYFFLFLIVATYVVYKFFLPIDVQKKIETEVLTYGFAFRLGVWSIDPPKVGYDFGKDAANRCYGYIHTEICESVLADTIDFSSYGRKSLYEYCIKSENTKKEYCAPNQSHMQTGIFHTKYIEIKKIFDEWKGKNPTFGNITIEPNNYAEWDRTRVFINVSCEGKNCTIMDFSKVLFDVFYAKFHKTTPYNYYTNLFTIDIDDEVLDHPEKLVEILDLAKEGLWKIHTSKFGE